LVILHVMAVSSGNTFAQLSALGESPAFGATPLHPSGDSADPRPGFGGAMAEIVIFHLSTGVVSMPLKDFCDKVPGARAVVDSMRSAQAF
jgi:hypothetical protein